MKFVIAGLIFIGSLIATVYLGKLLVFIIAVSLPMDSESVKDLADITGIANIIVPIGLTIWYWKSKSAQKTT